MDKVKLYHPILGTQTFEKEHAHRIMAREKNGGWSFKPIEVTAATAGAKKAAVPQFQSNQDAANGNTDKGETKGPEEKGGNTEGS